MLFGGTATAVLGGKLDSALALMHLASINVATHTPEVTHDKTLTGSHPLVGLSQCKREKFIIPSNIGATQTPGQRPSGCPNKVDWASLMTV